MNFVLIASMIIVVTFVILYGESARKTKSNQEVLALQKGFLKGCLVSLGLLVLPILGNLMFSQLQPRLSTIIFILELAAIALFGFRELRKMNYRKVKLFCLSALLVGIALIWWQLFSFYQMDRAIFNNLDFVVVPFMTWLATIVVVVFTYLGGPKLRAKKKSKAEVENAKLREQIEHMQNQQNKLQEDNEKLQNALQNKGTPEPKSVTEDKKAESNLPKNTQAEEESTTKVEEAQTTASAPKSDAEDKPKVEVTNPSMTEVQQRKLSEILDQLKSDSSSEAQQQVIEELIKSYRTTTVQEATAPEEKTSSRDPKSTNLEVDSKDEQEETEEEEEILEPVDFGDNYEDEIIFADLFTANNLVRAAMIAAIIIVVYVGVRV